VIKRKNSLESHYNEPELPKQLHLVDLYRKLIKEKINIFKSKGEIAEEQLSDILQYDISISKNHQKLALEVLLPEVKYTVLKLEESDMLAPEAISRIGIVQYVDDKPHFIHHTFAEYYVADFLSTHLTKETRFVLEVLDILIEILLGADYAVIRFFLDGILVNSEKSKALKQYGKRIYEIRRVCENKKEKLTRAELGTVSHKAAAEGNAHITDFIFSSLKATEKSDTIKKLMLFTDTDGKPAWYIAAEEGKEILEILWCWGREVQVNLKDDLLLSKGFHGRTSWSIAAYKGNKEILEKLWCWGREVKVNLKVDLLLSKGFHGCTAWGIAAYKGNKEILEKLWCWGREVQVSLKGDLLLSKSFDGQTAWNIAAEEGNKEILEKLWCWGREVKVNLKDDLLLSKGFHGRTAWGIAAYKGNKEILEKLWCWGREVQVNLKDDLLLSKSFDGETAWYIAAYKGNKEILEKLWCWGKEVQVNLKGDLLLSKRFDGLTAWGIAAYKGNKRGFREIVVLG